MVSGARWRPSNQEQICLILVGRSIRPRLDRRDDSHSSPISFRMIFQAPFRSAWREGLKWRS